MVEALYWSSKPETERLLSGIGIMVRHQNHYFQTRKPAIRPLRPHNLHVPPTSKQEACYTLFSVYAPTLQTDPANKDEFYTDLCNLIQNNAAMPE